MPEAIKLVEGAREAILKEHQTKAPEIRIKPDSSLLTRADLRVHEIIFADIKSLTPDLLVLSEESKEISYDERKQNKECPII